MTVYTYPGVYIQELPSPVHAIAGVPTSIVAFVGYTARGIDNRAQAIFSFGDFQRLYGGLASNSEVSYAVQQFYSIAGSGAQAYVVRTPMHYPSTGAEPYAKAGFGVPQTTGAGLTFSALSSGQWANSQVLLDVDVQNLDLSSSTGDPYAFNLTVTNLAGGTPEYFPSVTLNSSYQNFVAAVVNDPDNGSQLVNVAAALPSSPTALAATGVVGAALPYGGGITNVHVTAGGSGYSPSTVGYSISSATGSGAVLAPVVDAAGAITGVTVTNAGINYASTDSISFSGGSGATASLSVGAGANYLAGVNSGLTGDATTTTATADCSLTLSLPSPITPSTLVIKIIGNGSAIPQTVQGLASQLQTAINSSLAIAVPGASVACSAAPIGTTGNFGIRLNALLPNQPDALIAFSAPTGPSTPKDASAALGLSTPTSNNVAHYALGGTGAPYTPSNYISTPATAPSGLPWSTDLIGDPLAFTGIYALNKVPIFNLLSIPEAARALPSDSSAIDTNINPVEIYSQAITLCDQARAMLLIDPPPYVTTVSGAVDWKSNTIGVVDPNGAASWPRLRLADALNKGQLRTFAPSGVVAGVYAKSDGANGVWTAPAGISATLNGVQNMTYQLSDAENGVLNPLGLNCFRTFPIYGPVLWGARTLVGADAMANQWKYVPVRRMALFLESSLYQGTQWVVFQPNDERLWAAIRLNIAAFMQTYFLKGAFQGLTPTEAYFVKCDSETTTQTDIDNGVVNILVGFAPLMPAEFVVIQIEQLAGQSSS
jgi:phage tail sheath protein FI